MDYFKPRSDQSNQISKMKAVEVLAVIDKRFNENITFSGEGELGGIRLSNLKNASELTRFAYKNISNRLFLGLAFARLSDKMRFSKNEISGLDSNDLLRLEEVVKVSSSHYVNYASRDDVQNEQMPSRLSDSSHSVLLSALKRAVELKDDFMTGQVVSFIHISREKSISTVPLTA